MLPELDRAVAQLRRRALLSAWVARVGHELGWTLAAAAALVLVARGIGDWERTEAAWLFAPALIVPFAALVLARRRRPSASTAAAWLDVHAGASGIVVTESELGESSWSLRTHEALERARTALPQPDLARAAKAVLPALAFAVLALWVELPEHVVGPPPAVASAALERVEEKLETLEEALALEPELAEELQERLETLQSEAGEGTPESTFEALDRLEERVEQQAEEAERAAERAVSELASAANDPSLTDAQAALENALSQMSKAGLDKDLPQAVRETLAPGSLALPEGVQLSSAQLAKLSQELKGALDARLGKLAQGGLLDPSSLGKLGEPLSLEDFDDTHVCDEDCKKPGGT